MPINTSLTQARADLQAGQLRRARGLRGDGRPRALLLRHVGRRGACASARGEAAARPSLRRTCSRPP